MVPLPRISSLLLVNSRSRLAIHRAWPRYSSIKPATSTETHDSLRKNLPILLNPQPLESKPKKPLAFAQNLGLIDHTRSLTFKFQHLGFLWDPLNGVVSLTEEERSRCLLAVKKELASIAQPSKNQIQLRGVISALQHASHIVGLGRSRLEPLVECELGKGQGDEHGFLKGRIRRDLDWWSNLLGNKGDVTKIVNLQQGKVARKIYTDASPWGLAIVVAENWKNWKWKEGFEPDNNWAEATAVEMAVRHLVTQPGAEGSHFTIHCDSTAVVDSWTTGRCSGNPQFDKVMLSILHLTVQHGCWLSLEWIPSNQNLADKPSRSMTGLKLRNRLKCDSSVIPGETLKHFHIDS